MGDRVLLEVGEDRVGVVSLNRPDKLNALDQGTFEALADVAAQVRAAAEEGRVRAVLLTGEGRAFSAGLDVSLFGSQLTQAPSDEWIAGLQQSFTAYEDLPVPVVAGVRGAALGGGLQLALAAHLRVAAPDATFGLLEARWALLPDLGGLTRLPRLVGLGRATDLALSARTIDAPTALAWGLVDAVLDDEDFGAAARGYAARLATGPTVALGQIPHIARESFRVDRAASLAAERAAQQACLASADFREAATAALERRPPSFTGT